MNPNRNVKKTGSTTAVSTSAEPRRLSVRRLQIDEGFMAKFPLAEPVVFETGIPEIPETVNREICSLNLPHHVA